MIDRLCLPELPELGRGDCFLVSPSTVSVTPRWANSLRSIVSLPGRRAEHWNNIGILGVGVHDKEVPS